EAIDVLRRVSDAVPSALVVIACLDDVYERWKGRLTQSARDRLERDPPPIRLTSQRGREEIEALLARRLEHLYDACDVAWRGDEPIYPFRASQVERVVNQGARECLASFRRHHDACIAAGKLVNGVEIVAEPAADIVDHDGILNQTIATLVEPPDDDA